MFLSLFFILFFSRSFFRLSVFLNLFRLFWPGLWWTLMRWLNHSGLWSFLISLLNCSGWLALPGLCPGLQTLDTPGILLLPMFVLFPAAASSVGLVGGVFVGNSMDALSSDAPYSHSSSLMVFLYKKMERLDSSPNLSHSSASDTIALPTDATTNHRRKRCPHLNQGQHRHSSQAALPPLEVRQIR